MVRNELVGRGDDCEFVWIGTGEDEAVRELRAAGVEVTGWLSPSAVREELKRCSAYFHSASYEGFPISVLDAAALGLPVVVREIAAFEGVAMDKASTPSGAAEMLQALHASESAYEEAIGRSAAMLQGLRDLVPPGGLAGIYRKVAG